MDKNPDIEDIIADWLKEHGYDGLYNEECACPLDDLYPCYGGPCYDCQAGYAGKVELEGEMVDGIGPEKGGDADGVTE